MTLLTQDRALRHLYGLHEAMSELKAYGVSEQYNLEEEVLLFFRGSAEQVTQYWASAPANYLQDPIHDAIRRHMLCQWDRGDLFDAAQSMCAPNWTFEDALLVPKGPSALRASLLGRPDVQLGFEEDSHFATLGISPRLLGLGIANACADPLAMEAVECHLKGLDAIAGAQMRLEGAAGALKFLGTPYATPSDEGFTRTVDWAHAQWIKALNDGGIADKASPFLAALNRTQNNTTKPMQHILNTFQIPARTQSNHSQDLFEKLRDMVWSHGGAAASVGWGKVLCKLPQPLGMALSQAPSWPMDLTNTNLNMDPFVLAVRWSQWGMLECLQAHAQAHPDRMQITDDRIELWVGELARHMGEAKRVEPGMGNVRWKERLLAIRILLNTPGTWPKAWMTQQQQIAVQAWSEAVTPVLDKAMALIEQAVETHGPNATKMKEYFQTPVWKECALELVLASSQLTTHKPGARPRF